MENLGNHSNKGHDMVYNPKTTIHYCAQSGTPDNTNRIVPAPMISIQPEIYYANDSVIGYTYNITLNGYANSLRLDTNTRPSGENNYGADQTIGHMDDIRNIFNFNGGNLYIKSDGANVIVAKGATIKSINFDNSSNNWVNYSPFTIDIEFNEVDFLGCESNTPIQCNSTFFHTPTQSGNTIVSDNLVDMKKFKIKEFSDKWTVDINDQIYDNYSGFYNSNFRVSYDLSATGKNFYIDDKFVPAWQQARLFVQDRLYKQVNALVNGILLITPNNYDGCSSTVSKENLHNVGTSGGIMEGFDTPKNDGQVYQIYNEIITCNTSESNGTFSINYSAILKRYNSSFTPQENACIHTYTKNFSYDPSNKATINIQGNVQGLVQGGLIYQKDVEFTLPQSGSFVVNKDGAETRYSNALNFYNTRITNNDYDFNNDFKDRLGITKEELLINKYNGSKYPIPSSYSLDHNYHDGAISYNASYDTKTVEANDIGFFNVTISRKDPTVITQEFIIPGRIQGPLIQKLDMYNPRTISISIEGAHPNNRSCELNFCDSDPITNINELINLKELSSASWIKIKDDSSVNRIDGSFSINLEYMCTNHTIPVC